MSVRPGKAARVAGGQSLGQSLGRPGNPPLDFSEVFPEGLQADLPLDFSEVFPEDFQDLHKDLSEGLHDANKDIRQDVFAGVPHEPPARGAERAIYFGRRADFGSNAKSRFFFNLFVGLFFLALFWASPLTESLSAADRIGSAPILPVTVEQVVERPPDLFTQGLLFHDGQLFESSGLYKKSALRVYPASQLSSPGVLSAAKTLPLPPQIFAEGLAVAAGELYLLTWREGLVFVVDPVDLEVKRTIFQPGEGWGLTFDGQNLWRSDGSHRLQRHDPGDFRPNGPPLEVRDGAKQLRQLNELEWDRTNNLLLANIWGSDLVAAISPEDGSTLYYLDLSDIAEKEKAALSVEAVANGLAFDAEGRLWITGKLWPRLYRISYAPGQGTF
ncbi:MAG: glutaminyl-peptide cyclotransferase [Deltaproteobacteria bacterium]|jgi:glutamine cyclotransferase|nr:glutaminyl-peptide cyclotransferase [Deltaproteobacteria bacterium]